MGAPVIGLSGGIGAGKSTVATMLAEWGAHVIDADRVGHDVYRPGTEGFRQVAEAFGTRVVGATYFVLGLAACAGILWYAQAGESVTTSTQLRHAIHVLGLVFLYPAGLGLFAAIKGDEVGTINPLGFPMHPRWFSTLWILFAKEVRTFFTTGVPYIIMFAFSALNGFLFWLLVLYYTRPGATDLPKPGEILASNGFTLISSFLIWPA